MPLLSALVFILLSGIGAWPFVAIPFRNFKDKGFAFSLTVGWILISYVNFLLVTISSSLKLSLFQLNNPFTFAFSIILLAFVFFLFAKKHVFKIDKECLLFVAYDLIIFFSVLAVWYMLSTHSPAVYQIERVMDYGFISILLNSTTLPASDMWLSGLPINYYYFGHFMSYILLFAMNIPLEKGYFLISMLLPTLSSVSVFSVSVYLFNQLLPKSRKIYLVLSGFISVILFSFSGVPHMAIGIVKNLLYALGKGPIYSFWYPEPTRFITGTITEMPLYSFLEAEMHAHVFDMLISVIFISLLAVYWFEKRKPLNWAPLLGLFLGISLITNSWDVFSLGILAGIVFIFRDILLLKTISIKSILGLLLILIICFVVASPWYLFFKSPVASLAFVPHPSEFYRWFLFWGTFFTLNFVYILFVGFKKKDGRLIFNFDYPHLFGLAVLIAVSSLWIFCEVFYFKDVLYGTDWYRANTLFKLGTQIWTWLSITSGSIFVFMVLTRKSMLARLSQLLIILMIIVGLVYTKYAFKQSRLAGHEYNGISSGLTWFQEKYPFDYDAFRFLESYKNTLPQDEKIKVIVEGAGDSYTDNNFYSAFLGWSDVVGWPVHEWAWRGSYTEVGRRRDLVAFIYIGDDIYKTKQILKEFNVDFIIIGSVEKRIYTDRINFSKLDMLGTTFYSNAEVKVIKVTKDLL